MTFPSLGLSTELLQTSWRARLTELSSSLALEARLSFHLLTLVALHDMFFLFEDNCQGSPCTQTSPCCSQVLDSSVAEQGWFLLTGCYLQSFSISPTRSQTSSTHCLWNKCKQNLPISQFKEELTIQFRLAPYQSKPNLCYPCAGWNNSAHRTGHINVSANLVTLSVWPMPRDRVRELQQVDLEVTGKYHQSAPLLQDRSNDF